MGLLGDGVKTMFDFSVYYKVVFMSVCKQQLSDRFKPNLEHTFELNHYKFTKRILKTFKKRYFFWPTNSKNKVLFSQSHK